MNKKNNTLPQYIIDLMNGYCKRNSKSVIPISLTRLLTVFFFIFKKENLFHLTFKYPEIHHHFNENGQFVKEQQSDFFVSISSITANVAVSNECNKLIIKLGNKFKIEICSEKSQIIIKSKGTMKKITKRDGNEWRITKSLTKYIDLMIKINRPTNCDCPNGDGSIQLFFRNIQTIPDIAYSHSKNKSWWERGDIDIYQMLDMGKNPRVYGKIDKKETDGYCKILLPDYFDYYSKQQVSIEAHGTDIMNVWPAKNGLLTHAVDKYGFGTECCVDATWQYARKQSE